MAVRSDELEQQEWAVFRETEGTSNDGWFVDDRPSPSVTAGDTTSRLNSTEFDDWQDYSSSGKPLQASQNNVHKAKVNGFVYSEEEMDASLGSNSSSSSQKKEQQPLASTDAVRKVMEECYPSVEHKPTAITTTVSTNTTRLLSAEDKSLLSEIQTTAVSLTKFEWSRCLIKDQFLLAVLAYEEEEKTSKRDFMQDLDLGEFDEFDWNLPEKLERQGSIGSSDSNGVRFSPQDEFQGFFRPSCSRVDSPIELEFDHGKAVLGLSMLSVTDLTMMKNEMAGKVSKLSNDLVSLLQQRDTLHLDTITKNKFIQAMLKVQESKHAMQNTNVLSTGLPVEGESVADGSNGDESRYKRRPRSRSFQNLSRSFLARAKNFRTIEEDKTSSDVLLRVVIPYKHDAMGSWNVSLLKQWTKILLAVSERSPNVSVLISEYLTSVIHSPDVQSQTSTESQTSPDVQSQSDT